jgi:hypothetical protein
MMESRRQPTKMTFPVLLRRRQIATAHSQAVLKINVFVGTGRRICL